MLSDEAQATYQAEVMSRREAEPSSPTRAAGKKAKKAKASGAAAHEGAAAPVQPQTPLELARTRMSKLLKTGMDARQSAEKLASKELAGPLCTKLFAYAQKATKVFRKFDDLVNAGVNDEASYQALHQKVDKDMRWFEEEGKKAMAGFQRTLLASPKVVKTKGSKPGKD